MAGRTLAEVWVAVRPDTRDTGREIAQNLSRDTSITRVGQTHGHHYGAAVVKGATAPIRGGFSLLWRGVALGAASVGVGRILDESVKGFVAHQKVIAQTAQAIRSTGGAAKTSVGAVTALSDALERKTKVDGDVIQSGSNMLLTFTNIQNRVGKGNDIFDQATKTVLDMSVALGQDAPSSAIQLGKALNDPVKGVTALQRVGVTFTEQQRKQIEQMVKAGNVAGAQRVVLAELNKEFGGSAKAQGDALGASGRLTVAWHQAQDTIGAALLPVVSQLEDALAKRLPGAADKAAKAVPRITAGAQGLYDLVVKGDFTGKFRTAFHLEEDDPTVDRILRIRDGVIAVAEKLRTVDFRSLAGQAGDLASKLKDVDWAGLGQQVRSIDTAHLGDVFHVAGVGAGFLADHLDLLAKSLPVLVALYAGYKATVAVANLAEAAGIPAKVAQAASNIVLARAIRSLAMAQAEQTGTTIVNTAVTNAGTAALVGGRLATLRSAAAMIVSKVATLAVAAATKTWTAGQWLLNAALAANPVGLVIAAIAALAVGVIYAYRHSETFRKIVDGAFRAVAAVGKWMWEGVLRPAFAALVDAFLAVAGAIVHGAATAFGWLPGIGDDLKDASAAFDRFRKDVNDSLLGVKDRNVVVRATLTASSGSIRAGGTFAAQHGWRIPGYGGGDTVPLLAERGEAIIPKHLVPEIAPWARTHRIPGFAQGGVVGGLTVTPQLAGMPAFTAALSRFNATVDKLAAQVPQAPQFTAPASVSAVATLTAQLLGRQGEAPAWARRIMFESGGRWDAVNRWDSNWRAGHPSVGGAQVIAGTFAAYAGPYRNRGPFAYGVSMDPLANSYAGGNYAVHRYGSLAAVDPLVRPRGYDSGGWLPPGVTLAVNRTGQPEKILGPGQDRPLVVQLVCDGRVLAEVVSSQLLDAMGAGARR